MLGVPELITAPCQSLTKPHLQMGARPISSRMIAAVTIMLMQAMAVSLRVSFIGASMHRHWLSRHPSFAFARLLRHRA
jgi:hypothetical protein